MISIAPQPIPSSRSDRPADWIARLQQGIAEREYDASSTDAGLQAPNRANDLRTFFEPTGIRIHDRTAAGSPELFRLSLTRLGRGAAIARVEPGTEVVAEENRVEIRRPGLTEWYTNSSRGLEQGFTLAERPGRTAGANPGRSAANESQELVLELSVDGARAIQADDDVEFNTGTGRKFAYGELAVVDTNGRNLAARLSVSAEDRIRIFVDDRGATYPIVIDPLLAAASDARIESDQASAALGFSVASAGDVNGDGHSDVIVGAPSYDAGQSNEGAAFVFLGSAGGIESGSPDTVHAQIESNQASARMGHSVASAGDVDGDGYADVIVGARDYSAGETTEGAAFVFLGSPNGIPEGSSAITANARLEANQSTAAMGNSVASAGDVNGDGYADVIVGASNYSSGQANEGAAFVFLGSPGGISNGVPATAHARLESNQASASFGETIASAGDVNGDGYSDVIVGASNYNSGQSGEGAAFVFLGSAAGIANGNPATANTRLESDQASAAMGRSVASAGDVNGDGHSDVIVGSIFYDAGQTNEGAAFVYLGSVNGIANGNPAGAHARLEGEQPSAVLGQSVASAGDVNGDGYADVIVGAIGLDADQTDEGAALVFLGSASGIANGNPSTAHAVLEGNQTLSSLGSSVASAGDVNGDGYADVIVGAATFDAGQTDEGASFVYYGGARAIKNNAVADAKLYHYGSELGRSVSAAGDVNGDGYDDVIIGAPRFDKGQFDEGAAFAFLGGPSGLIGIGSSTLLASAASIIESNQPGARLGESVDGAGDLNGDGYADVIVGAPRYDAGAGVGEGLALVFHGSATGLVANGNPGNAQAHIKSNQSGAQLGGSVAGAGDLDGDGWGDLLIGAALYDGPETDEGAVFVFDGGPGGVGLGNPANADVRLEVDQAGANFGRSLDSAGDVNGDGHADVVIGAPNHGFQAIPPASSRSGAAFVYLGSSLGLVAGIPATTLTADTLGQRLGDSVAGAGDVNADGYSDLIVGDHGIDAGSANLGAAFVFHGSASGIPSGGSTTARSILRSDLESVSSYARVSAAGDINGDGYADVLIGTSAAYAFLGGPAGIASGGFSTAATRLGSFSGLSEVGVSSAGDVNGDGYADVIVGDGTPPTFQYTAALFLGNRGGRSSLPGQLRTEPGAFPIAPWGAAYSLNSFDVRMRATHPNGRGLTRLEVEACLPGVAFGHASCVRQFSPSWTDTAATPQGVDLETTVAGLNADTTYRWRARVLTAPLTLTKPGITWTNQAQRKSPWRRLAAQSVAANVRTVIPDMDSDGDGVAFASDNCTFVSNPLQQDADRDGIGDACDNCVGTPNPRQSDGDFDERGDPCDNCQWISNANQTDADFDGIGDLCENSSGTGSKDVGGYFIGGPGQVSNFNYYRWKQCPTCQFVAPLSPLPEAGGQCSMIQVSTSGSSASYFITFSSPDQSGFACCAYDKLATSSFSPPLTSQDIAVFKWGIYQNAPNTSADEDIFPDLCDNCPQVSNEHQEDADGDEVGDPCDPAPIVATQCGDSDGDHCDDCVSGKFNTNTDQVICLPEPTGSAGIGLGLILIATRVRRRYRSM